MTHPRQHCQFYEPPVSQAALVLLSEGRLFPRNPCKKNSAPEPLIPTLKHVAQGCLL